MKYHQDPLRREELIRDYLLKRLDSAAVEAFESHYLACQECFEELRASQMIIAGLPRSVDVRRLEDVLVLQFTSDAQLTRHSRELQELAGGLLEQKDTKVLIDLSRVSRVDSAGLGVLMTWYSHAVRNRGVLKLLNPNTEVQRLLRMTRMDSVVETYFDEHQALQSFQASPPERS
jgi:anti-sigma B factor antagonist